MPASPAPTTAAPRLAFHEVLSDDGTRLRAWTNDPDGVIDGPTVVLCNGLGTSAWAWPAFLAPDCDVRVVSWNHRGTGGSDRPVDPERVGIEQFAEDGVSVMDHFGIDKAVLVGWSMGVNTAFEIGVDHPERVAGLFAVAGVPGDTFATMLGPLRLPPAPTRAIAVGAARVLERVGHLVTPVTSRLPVGRRAIDVLSHSGFMLPVADPEMARKAVAAFLQTPVEWYFHVAIHTSYHPRIRLSRIAAPAVFVAGTWDLLAGPRAMATAASRMADATYTELRGTHFLQMEHPDEVHRRLVEFVRRVG